MPLLEVLTRCYRRPAMLAANQASLQRQTDSDWIQTLLIDDEGRGIGWSYRNMAAYAPKLTGDYIWILDDDDVCMLDTLVEDVRKMARKKPDVIFVRMNHGPRGVLPGRNWRNAPMQGDIGVSAYIVKRQIWQLHSNAFGNHYAGDFDFISQVYARTQSHMWYDAVASEVQRISNGEPE